MWNDNVDDVVVVVGCVFSLSSVLLASNTMSCPGNINLLPESSISVSDTQSYDLYMMDDPVVRRRRRCCCCCLCDAEFVDAAIVVGGVVVVVVPCRGMVVVVVGIDLDACGVDDGIKYVDSGPKTYSDARWGII